MIGNRVGASTFKGWPKSGNTVTSGPRAIQVYREEEEAIERLKALRFAEKITTQNIMQNRLQ